MKLRRWAGLVLFCLLGACASKPPPPAAVPAAPPPVVLIDPTAACLQGLDQRHVQFERSADFHTPEGCGIDGYLRGGAEVIDPRTTRRRSDNLLDLFGS